MVRYRYVCSGGLRNTFEPKTKSTVYIQKSVFHWIFFPQATTALKSSNHDRPLWFLPGNAFGLQASNKFFIHSFCVFSQISSITAQPSRNVRDASDNAAGKPRTEWVEIFSYCVKSCGIYIASPSDSTWLGILRTNYVGGVAQLAQPLMRILTSLQTRTYPKFTERVRMSRSPPPVVIKLWACSVRVLLPQLWLAEGQ